MSSTTSSIAPFIASPHISNLLNLIPLYLKPIPIFKKLYLRTLGRILPTDLFSHRFPVSVKGICFIGDEVILVKTERGTWDLPGGKLRHNEPLHKCLARELQEELGIAVDVKQLLTLSRVKVMNMVDVLVPIYYCTTKEEAGQLRLSDENFDIGTFPIGEIEELKLPHSYQQTIEQAYQQKRELL